MIGQDGKVYLHGKVTIFKIYDATIPQMCHLFKSLKGTYHEYYHCFFFHLQGPALTMQVMVSGTKTQ